MVATVPIPDAKMPKKKTRRNDVSVKIDAEAYRLVKTAASWKGEEIAAYLSRIAAAGALQDIAGISPEAKSLAMQSESSDEVLPSRKKKHSDN
jgi:hypothetical protein